MRRSVLLQSRLENSSESGNTVESPKRQENSRRRGFAARLTLSKQFSVGLSDALHTGIDAVETHNQAGDDTQKKTCIILQTAEKLAFGLMSALVFSRVASRLHVSKVILSDRDSVLMSSVDT